MERSLELSPERIAAELEHARQIELANRKWTRRVAVTLLVAAGWCVLGWVVFAFGFHTTDPDLANVFFWGGLLLSNCGPVYTGFWFWSRLDS